MAKAKATTQPALPRKSRAKLPAIGASNSGAAIMTIQRRRTVRATGAQAELEAQQRLVVYVPSKGIDHFVASVRAADPMQLIETERRGVAGVFVKDLSKRMGIPAHRMFAIVGVPKATAEKKAADGQRLAGNGGRAALGIARLLGMAEEIVDNSTAPEARDFDSARWLGKWLERPQPALGGHKPSELIDTPTGLDVVARLLGAIESGAYQ